jgi:flagellar assembly protein FliH
MNALFLRDFDAERATGAQVDTTTEHPEETSEPLFTFTEAELGKMLAEARAEGHLQGLNEGEAAGRQSERQTIEAEALEALQELQNRIADFATEDARRRSDMQQDIIDLFLDVAERIAPDFLTAYSADLVQARITEAVHLGAGHSTLKIQLSPETQAALSDPLKVIAPTGALLPVDTDADFKNGEAQVIWDNGFLKYNLDRVVSELLDGLRDASSKMNPQPQKV